MNVKDYHLQQTAFRKSVPTSDAPLISQSIIKTEIDSNLMILPLSTISKVSEGAEKSED